MKNFYTKYYIFVISGLMLIIFSIILYYYFKTNNKLTSTIELPIAEISLQKTRQNKCIFSPFIELFKINNSSYTYFPSYFAPIEIRSIQACQSISMLDYIRQEQYKILGSLVNLVFDNLGTRCKLSN